MAKKKMVEEREEIFLDLNYQTLKDIKKVIEHYIEKYGEDVEYQHVIRDGWVENYIITYREETDEEYDRRIKEEKEFKEKRRKRDLEELERLKKIYE